MCQAVGSIVEQPEVGCLNGILYLRTEKGQQWEVMLLSILKAGRQKWSHHQHVNTTAFKSGEQVGVGFIGTDSFNPTNNCFC